MALSDTDLHWIPMNRDKFNQLRKMFDAKEGAKVPTVPCDKCTSPRIRYSSAENVTALSQIRALLRPVEPDDSSTSSRSRNTSEDSVEGHIRTDGCNNNIIRDNKTRSLPNGFVVIDPVACQKSNGFLKLNGSAEVLSNINCHLKESEVDPLQCNTDEITYNFTDNTKEPAVELKSLDNTAAEVQSLANNEVKSLDTAENESCEVFTTGHNQSLSTDHIDSKKECVLSAEDSDNSLDENKFRSYVSEEAERLGKKREYWVSLLEGGEHTINEEVTGRIMATCGKANLLLTSKFKQYRTLCTEFETKSGAKMTSDDMQGFWELILLQVNDVNKMFEECRVMENSNWQPPKSPMPPKKKPIDTPVKRKTTRTPAKPKAKSAAQIARDEARRKLMTERKEQMRHAKMNAANNGVIEIFT